MFHRAFTFIETLVCIAIVVTLAGFVFLLSAPSRESARQDKCVQNMHQIYEALIMYRSDYPDGYSIPNSDIPAFDGLHPLFAYGTNLETERCPDAPSDYYPKSSTYEWRSGAFWPTHKDDPAWWKRLNDERDQLGDKYPIVLCHMHDIMYYQPRESGVFSGTLPFEIQLRIDGSVFRGRLPGPHFPLIP